MEWILELKDRMSEAAERAAKSLEHVKGGLEGADKASNSTVRAWKSAEAAERSAITKIDDHSLALKSQLAQTKTAIGYSPQYVAKLENELKATDAARLAHEVRQREMAKGVTAAQKAAEADNAWKGALSETAGALGMVAAGGTAVVAVTGGIVAGVALATNAFMEEVWAGNQAAFVTRNMFAAMSGGASTGEEEWQSVWAIAKKTIKPIEQVRSTFSTLAGVGLKGKLLEDLTTMQMDFDSMSESARFAFKSVMQAAATGDIKGQQFTMLAKTLGGKEAFGAALGLSATALGDSAGAAKALDAELGKIKPERFLEVAVALHTAKRGLGDVAASTATVAQRWADIKEEFFIAVGQNVDFGFMPILTKIDEFVAGPSGQTLIRDLTGAAQAVATLGKEFIDGFLDPVLSGVPGASSDVATLSERLKDPAVRASLREVGELAGKSVVLLEKLAGVGSDVGSSFTALSGILGGLGIALTNGLAIPVVLIGDTINMMKTGKPSELFLAGVEMGSNLVSGIVSGIKSEAEAAVGAVVGVVDQIKAAFTGPAGIDAHSPSKVFEKYGEWSMEGYERGFVANDTTVADVGGTVASQVGGNAQAALSSTGGAGGGNIYITFGPNSVVVSGGGSLTASAEADLETQMTRIMRRSLLASRGAPVAA